MRDLHVADYAGAHFLWYLREPFLDEQGLSLWHTCRGGCANVCSAQVLGEHSRRELQLLILPHVADYTAER